MWKCVLSFSLVATIAQSYPSTITKYSYCKSCHVSPGGGLSGPLNDYGRSMSEAFMATFSRSHEAREFVWMSTRAFDIGADFRALGIRSQDAITAFPMLIDGEITAYLDRFFFDVQLGLYGRDGELESRRHFVGFETKIRDSLLNIRLGKFMPAYGIMDSNHSLWIKSRLGLGRGKEHYGLEAYFKYKKYWQIFAGYGLSFFKLATTEDGLYAGEPKHFQRGTVRASMTYFKKFELGVSAMKNQEDLTVGGFTRMSPLKNYYAIIEYDQNINSGAGVGYFRMGYFLFRGFDFYKQFELSLGDISENRQTLGFHWMVRPRMELDLSVTKQGNDLSQTLGVHLWM